MNNPDIRKDVAGSIRILKTQFDRIDNLEMIDGATAASLLGEVEVLYKKLVVLNYQSAIDTDSAAGEETLGLNTSQSEVFEKQGNPAVQEQVVVEVENAIPAEEVHLPVEEATVVTELKEEAMPVPPIEIKVEQPVAEIREEIKSAPKVPRPDIKAGIGINDKFQFIAELFAGSADNYEESIKQLNSIETAEASMQYLDEIRGRYQWKEESESAQRLTELVKRRFL